MDDENLSGSEKEHSSGDCPNPNPAQETNGNPQPQNPPRNGDAVRKFGVAAYVGEIVLAGLCGTGVWIFGEHLVSHGYSKSGVVVNILAFIIYFAAAPLTAIRFWPKPFRVWSLFGVFCLIMVLLFTATSMPESKPRPHFKLSLLIGNPPIAIVQLTNSFLFGAGVINVIHFTNNFLLFNGIPGGCLVIPTASDESNKVFGFVVENDSPIKATDLMAFVGFPIDWELGFDPATWHNVGIHYTIPGWRLQDTNLQFLATEFPRPLSPTDIVYFPPITNFSIPASNNPTNKIGMFKLIIRATDFESMISSEIFFIRIPSTNVFKPFLTSMKLGTDGLWRADVSSNTLKNLPK
jgi:hypothetical protein